jgi:hypothetical protein
VHRLVDLLGDWDDAAAEALFADNVAPDDPYVRRAAAAAHLVEACRGPLVIEAIDPVSATAGVVRLRHPSGTPVRIVVELAPLTPPQVQEYRIELPPVGTDGDAAG